MERLLFGSDAETTAEVATLLLDRLAHSEPFGLRDPVPTEDPGVYALFYDNPRCPLYGGLTVDMPLYVGKAGQRLSERLRKHAASIEAAENLDAADLVVRVLAIRDCVVAAAETVLIAEYEPLWNTVVKGFGNNPPGRGRSDQCRSPWDTLHPGRAWAAGLTIDRPRSLVIDDVLRWCSERHRPAPVVAPPDEVHLRVSGAGGLASKSLASATAKLCSA